jgi:hypothetical protein
MQPQVSPSPHRAYVRARFKFECREAHFKKLIGEGQLFRRLPLGINDYARIGDVSSHLDRILEVQRDASVGSQNGLAGLVGCLREMSANKG